MKHLFWFFPFLLLLSACPPSPDEEPLPPPQEEPEPENAPDAGSSETPPETTDAGSGETPPETTDAGTGETPPETTDAGSNETPPETTDAGTGFSTEGHIATSCGASSQGLVPVDCTQYGDENAFCVYSNHCACGEGFECEVQYGFGSSNECEAGSVCIPITTGTDAGNEEIPPTTDAGNVETPPATDAGNEEIPPATDAGSTEIPPATDAGSTETPPATDAGSTETPPTTDGGGGEPSMSTDAGTQEEMDSGNEVLGCAGSINELFISEYIEGSNDNRYIEIFNGTDQPINLEYYSLKKGVDGSDWMDMVSLLGDIYPSETYYVCHPDAPGAMECWLTSEEINFDGNDAIGLFLGDELIDIVGQVGEDPGDAWAVDDGSTQDHTLIRLPTVSEGTTDWGVGANQWAVYDMDTNYHIEAHTTECEFGSYNPPIPDCNGELGGTATTDDCDTCDSDPNNDCIQDCNNVWGGDALEDECGNCDNDTNNDCIQDCNNVWGGDGIEDDCGTCDNDTANDCTQDCNGEWGGDAVQDNCGNCDDDPNNDCNFDCAGEENGTAVLDQCGSCDSDPNNDCTQDCAGEWGGGAAEDECGTCDNDANNDCIQDCNNVWGGNDLEDECGACDNDINNDCIQDCNNIWGGDALEDECGACDNDTNNDCIQDCNNVWGGDALEDGCGTCDNDTNNDCIQDCNNVWGGDALEDECGTCDNNTANDCIQDCNDIWGGPATLDNCNICDSDTANDDTECEQDCNDQWAGTAVMDDCGDCVASPELACTTVCGDGNTTLDEICDDGDTIHDNGCDSDCQTVSFGFACTSTEEGFSQCISICGDGIRASNEACDNNNTADNDGCAGDCLSIELHWTCGEDEDGFSICTDSCGNGVRENFEECDNETENNIGSYGSCGTRCLLGDYCGDGKINGPEICDDGNSVDGDGCAADCLEVETGFICETEPDALILNGDEDPRSLALSGRYIYWSTFTNSLWRKDLRANEKINLSLADGSSGPVVADDEALFFTHHSQNDGLQLYRLAHGEFDLAKAHLLYESAGSSDNGPAIALKQSATHLYILQMGLNETPSRIFQVGKHSAGENACLIFSEVISDLPSCSGVTTKITGIHYGTHMALDPHDNLYFQHEFENEAGEESTGIIKVAAGITNIDLATCEAEESCSSFFETPYQVQHLSADHQHLYWAAGEQGIQRKAIDEGGEVESLLVSQASPDISQVFALEHNLLWTSFQNLQRGMKASALHSQANDQMTGLSILDLQTQGPSLFFIQSHPIGGTQLVQARLADSSCVQRLSWLQANAMGAQITQGLLLPNGDGIFSGQGENVFGVVTQGTDGFLLRKSFERNAQDVLRLSSVNQSDTATTEAFISVERDTSGQRLLALAHFCEGLALAENCSAQLHLEQEEGFEVGSGIAQDKAGLILSLNADFSIRWAREILPAEGSTIELVRAAVADDGSVYVGFTHLGEVILTSNPNNQTIAGNTTQIQSTFAAYDIQGNLKWVESLSASEGLFIQDFDIIEDQSNGHLLIAGGAYSGTTASELGGREASATSDGLLITIRDEGNTGDIDELRFLSGTENSVVSAVHARVVSNELGSERIVIAGTGQSNLDFINSNSTQSTWTYTGNNAEKEAFIFYLGGINLYVYSNKALASGRTDQVFPLVRFTDNDHFLALVHTQENGIYGARINHLDGTSGNILWQRDFGNASDPAHFRSHSLDWYTHKQILITGHSAQNTLAQLPIYISVGNPTGDQTIDLPSSTIPDVQKSFALDLNQSPSGYYCDENQENCTSLCGDGIRTPNENCDDNNTANEDGCNAACEIEIGYSCSGDNLSVCIYDCSGLDAGDCELIDPCNALTEDCTGEELCDGGFCSNATACPSALVGETQSCGIPMGLCTAGTKTCQENEVWSDCIRDVEPSPEVCDGEDNNCNGQNDEGLQWLQCGVGACFEQIYSCSEDGEEVFCPTIAQENLPSETCDGADNNCNGEVDEDLQPIVCGNGQCQVSMPRCSNGQINQCTPNPNVGTELCDDLDNDCDGQADEGLPYRVCGYGVCATPIYSCSGAIRTFEPGQFRQRFPYEDHNILSDVAVTDVWTDHNNNGHTDYSGWPGEVVRYNAEAFTWPKGRIACDTDENVAYTYNTDPSQGLTNTNYGGDGIIEIEPGIWESTTPEQLAGYDTLGGVVEYNDHPQYPPAQVAHQTAVAWLSAQDSEHEYKQWFFNEDHPEWGYFYADENLDHLTYKALFSPYISAEYHPLKSDEICDGLDNDCDDAVDEDLPPLVCGNEACPLEIEACQLGVPQECPPLPIQPEICDDADNNCNGEIDEGLDCTAFGGEDKDNQSPSWGDDESISVVLADMNPALPAHCEDPNVLEPGAPNRIETETGWAFENEPAGLPIRFSAPLADPDGTIVKVVIDWGDGSTTETNSECMLAGQRSWLHYYATGGYLIIRATAYDNNGAATFWQQFFMASSEMIIKSKSIYYRAGDGECLPLHNALFCDENNPESPCPQAGDNLLLRLYIPVGTVQHVPHFHGDNGNEFYVDPGSDFEECNAPGFDTEHLQYTGLPLPDYFSTRISHVPLSNQAVSVNFTDLTDNSFYEQHPVEASYTVGNALPSVTIDVEETPTYATGEMFQLTVSFTDDQEAPSLVRWVISDGQPPIYDDVLHTYIPSVGSYTVQVTAWDKWGYAAHDEINLEIQAPPFADFSTTTTLVGETSLDQEIPIGVGFHPYGLHTKFKIEHGLDLADITGFEIFINHRRGVLEDGEKDLAGRLKWLKETDTTTMIWGADTHTFQPSIEFLLEWSSQPQYLGTDPYGTQHLLPLCPYLGSTFTQDSECLANYFVNDFFANGSGTGMGGCDDTFCSFTFRFARSYGVEEHQKTGNDIAYRILTAEGPYLSSEANPEGWFNHDSNIGVNNRAIQLTLAGGQRDEAPGSTFFHLDMLANKVDYTFVDAQTMNADSNNREFWITAGCSTPLIYFVNEALQPIYSYDPAIDPRHSWGERIRQLFEEPGAYYAMACCSGCVGGYSWDAVVPRSSNVVQFIVHGDSDGDGIEDHEDPDDDNDGACDYINESPAGCSTDPELTCVCTMGPEPFPKDGSQWADSDGDGVGDNLDGCTYYYEKDEAPSENCEGDAFPNDPTEWEDSDGDDIGDNADDDDDNDGLTDAEEIYYGTNPYNPDSDADFLSDYDEILFWHSLFGAEAEIPDSDADGLVNQLDPDSDGDGWKDGKEEDPDTDLDNDGLVNILDPDSDNDGLKDGYDHTSFFNPNLETNNNSGGSGGLGFFSGSPGLGGDGDTPEDAENLWRKIHPANFIEFETEVVGGKMAGETKKIDWECFPYYGCEEEEVLRDWSCQDTVRSGLLNNSLSETTLAQFNWQMNENGFECDEIREEFDGLFPIGFDFTWPYPTESNISSLNDIQYLFKYNFNYKRYLATCHNTEPKEVPDSNDQSFEFQIKPVALVPGLKNVFQYQTVVEKTAGAEMVNENSYRIPGLRYRFYHFDSTPQLPVTNLDGATLVYSGQAFGTIDNDATETSADKTVINIDVKFPEDAWSQIGNETDTLYLYLSPYWDEVVGENHEIQALDTSTTAFEIFSVVQQINLAHMQLIVKPESQQSQNPLFAWGDIADALKIVADSETENPFENILEWDSGTRSLPASESSQTFNIGVFNNVTDGAGKMVNDFFDTQTENLDAILIVANNALSAQKIIFGQVFCEQNEEAPEDCVWHDYIKPIGGTSETGLAPSPYDGTFYDLSITIGGGENENTIWNLVEDLDAGRSMAEKAIGYIKSVPVNRPIWHTPSYTEIPTSKTLEIFTDENVTLRIMGEGSTENTFVWDVMAQFQDELPWDDASLTVEGQSKIYIHRETQIATQKIAVDWDPNSNTRPPLPELENMSLVDTALDNSSKSGKMTLQRNLSKSLAALEVASFPFMIVFNFQEMASLSNNGGWDTFGSLLVYASAGVEIIIASKLLIVAVAVGPTKLFSVLGAGSEKVLGKIFFYLELGRGLGYAVKALDAGTGAARARCIEKVVSSTENLALMLALSKVGSIAAGAAVIGVYAGSILGAHLLNWAFGNELTGRILGSNPFGSILNYWFGPGILSSIIEEANGQAITTFYDYYCIFHNLGYENVVLLTPDETITNGCTTACEQDYTKSNCYSEPDSSDDSSQDACSD